MRQQEFFTVRNVQMKTYKHTGFYAAFPLMEGFLQDEYVIHKLTSFPSEEKAICSNCHREVSAEKFVEVEDRSNLYTLGLFMISPILISVCSLSQQKSCTCSTRCFIP
jgi:hypothetical protein